MLQTFILDHIGELITAVIGGLGGWFFQRKQKHAELESLKANNSQKIVDLYQESLDDLKERYDERFSDLNREMDNLRRNLNEWKRKYNTLKSEFDEYRKNHGK